MTRRAPRFVSYAVAGIAAVAVGLGSGAAYAFWSSSGTGTGSASVGTPAPVTVVTASGTVSSLLVPGGSADLLVALDNPNSFPVTITSITQTTPVVGPGGACVTTGVSIGSSAVLPVTVPSGNGVVVTVTNGASMALSSDSGCQGASFSIPISVTVRR
jgi:hypothetical protein